MKDGAGKPRVRSSSMARLTAQKLAALELAVPEDSALKNVTVKLDESSLRMLDSLAKTMRSSRQELAQELLMAAIEDMVKMVSARVKPLALTAAD
jgi:thioesterase domain-containing protein